MLILMFLWWWAVWVMYWFCVLFFFQAEDGIRDLVRSRGLGDVYKRQVWGNGTVGSTVTVGGGLLATGHWSVNRTVYAVVSVSYTHLTLPTSDLV